MADEENWSLVLPGLCICVYLAVFVLQFSLFFWEFCSTIFKSKICLIIFRTGSVEFKQKPKLFRFQTNGDSNYTIDFETLL